MKARNRGAFTLIELLTVMAIIGLLIAMLTPPLSRAREMARRTLCLGNLSGLGKGCITYSIAHNGHFPYAGAAQGAGYSKIGDAWDWDGVSTKVFGGGPAPTSYEPISNTRHIWKLVEFQTADTKAFLCPSDPMAGEPFTPPFTRPAERDRASISDVQNRSQFSYAFQYQGPALTGANKRQGWTTSGRDDSKIVFLADTSPAFHATNPEAVATSDNHSFELATSAPSVTFPEGNIYCGVLASLTNIVWDPMTAKASYSLARSDEIAAINSPNHRGDGQNVVRLDGSGDFAGNPWAGAYMDNIWTVQDPTEYASATPDASKMLEDRMKGLYDATEATVLQDWVLHQESKGRYPDTFLVP